jgi:hypothetical protein
MKIQLALLAVPFLALACRDAEQATLLEPPAISADVTTEALVTTFVQFKLRCGSGVTGSVFGFWKPSGEPTGRTNCGEMRVVDTSSLSLPPNSVDVIFDTSSKADCPGTARVELSGRAKCTVNGLNASGKPSAVLSARYVKG